MDANESSLPCNILLGTVTSEAPLKIRISQKQELTEDFLILARNVTEYEVDMTVDHKTETAAGGSGDAQYASHSHDYKGRKTWLVHNGLKVGEIVIIARIRGGQQYYVLDRLEVK